MQHQLTSIMPIKERHLLFIIIILLLLSSFPSFAHPGSGTPAYMSINLFQITIAANPPVDNIDYAGPVGGKAITMRVNIQHGNLSTINSVCVQANEQLSADNNQAILQSLMIDGFTKESTSTDGTGDAAVITEIWSLIVDSRNDWSDRSIQRTPGSYVAKLHNEIYSFRPIVTYSMLGTNFSTVDNSLCSIDDRLVPVSNASLTVTPNSGAIIGTTELTLTAILPSWITDKQGYDCHFEVFWPDVNDIDPSKTHFHWGYFAANVTNNSGSAVVHYVAFAPTNTYLHSEVSNNVNIFRVAITRTSENSLEEYLSFESSIKVIDQ